MPGKNIAIPDEIYERVRKIATAEGTTVEELATKALERDLARRWLERVGREGQLRRGNLTDDEVEAAVERAVQGSRRGS
jgi:predicted CopG family antitoxin